MAEQDSYYEKLDDENRRLYFPQRYYTERIAALEARLADLQAGLDAQHPAAPQPAQDSHKSGPPAAESATVPAPEDGGSQEA